MCELLADLQNISHYLLSIAVLYVVWLLQIGQTGDWMANHQVNNSC
jgi:hypothetical protein